MGTEVNVNSEMNQELYSKEPKESSFRRNETAFLVDEDGLSAFRTWVTALESSEPNSFAGEPIVGQKSIPVKSASTFGEGFTPGMVFAPEVVPVENIFSDSADVVPHHLLEFEDFSGTLATPEKSRNELNKNSLQALVPFLLGTLFLTVVFGGAMSLIFLSDFDRAQLGHPLLQISRMNGSAEGPASNLPIFIRSSDINQVRIIEKNAGIFFPDRRRIILRMDDVQDYSARQSQQYLIRSILDKNLALSIGIIPENFGADKNMLVFLLEQSKNQKLEIALHGFDHSAEEFKPLSYEEASVRIQAGSAKLESIFGRKPIVFIPPYNVYNDNTLLALSDQNFVVLSALDEFRQVGSLRLIGRNARVVNYSEKENDEGGYLPPQITLSECKKGLDQFNLCVIMFHPQEYVIDKERKILDENRILEFEFLLAELQKLNAETTTFESFVLGN